jgi:hypothetical protein
MVKVDGSPPFWDLVDRRAYFVRPMHRRARIPLTPVLRNIRCSIAPRAIAIAIAFVFAFVYLALRGIGMLSLTSRWFLAPGREDAADEALRALAASVPTSMAIASPCSPIPRATRSD